MRPRIPRPTRPFGQSYTIQVNFQEI